MKAKAALKNGKLHPPHAALQALIPFRLLYVLVAVCITSAYETLAEESGTATVACRSAGGERAHCPANVSNGVILSRSTGEAACLLGRSWGYDATGVWVTEGCEGVFHVSADSKTTEHPPAVEKTSAAENKSSPLKEAGAGKESADSWVSAKDGASARTGDPGSYETWGTYDPGDGFLVGRTDVGELSLSAYALLRYLDQNDSNREFTDHLGNERKVDTRQDIYSHRVLVFLKGWVGAPELIYNIIFWTVNTTDQDALFGNLGYQFAKEFSLYGGVNGNPGSRSLQGSHPYWLGHDRVMADEFFRPFFTQGIWAMGEPLPGLWYSGMVGNNSSTLGVTASQLDRSLTRGLSMWWMPTTHEFGPRGAYGDWEYHQDFATRIGFSLNFSTEERQGDPATGDPDNTALRLADSLNVFDTGSLAPGISVDQVHYRLLALDAGFKYRGIFFQTEAYQRWLDDFVADGALPVSQLIDRGFYIQSAFFPIEKKLELYGITSQIFGDESAGFGDSAEYGFGLNYYPFNTRNHRLNLQLLRVLRSPVSSNFGYYIGGQDGVTFSTAFSIFF